MYIVTTHNQPKLEGIPPYNGWAQGSISIHWSTSENKKESAMVYPTTWMTLKCIMHGHSQKARNMIPFIWCSGEGKMPGKENTSAVVRHQSPGAANDYTGVWEDLWGDRHAPHLDCHGSWTSVGNCQSSENCVLKQIIFTIYKLYLEKPDLKKQNTKG